MQLDRKTLVWKGITIGVGAAAGATAERALGFAWGRIAGHAPPKDPADRRSSWVEALLWGVAAGIGFGAARVVANRSAAAIWEMATDETPPGVPDRGSNAA